MTNPLEVGDHSNQFIFITPDYGYEIDSVVIDKDTPSAHTLDANEMQTVIREGGYNFIDVTADHTLYATFKAMDPAPPVFDKWDELKTRIESMLYAYSTSDVDATKAAFCSDLWDMVSHEYQGAFINKAALVAAVTVNGANPLQTDSAVLNLPYYTFTVDRPTSPASTLVTGKIYVLGDNQILIKAAKNNSANYQLVNLTPAFGPSYEDVSVTIDYDLASSIQVGGAHIEGKTGQTDYCVSFHLSVAEGGCQLFVYKPEFRGVIARGEGKIPFAWDFGNTPFVALNNTTADTPFVLTTFFGFSSLDFVPTADNMRIDSMITTLPEGVVSISGSTVTFLSNFYDSVPLTVTYTYGGVQSVGYVLVQRVGIDIQSYSKQGSATTCQTNHGTQPGIVFDWGSDDCAIYATYYYPGEEALLIDSQDAGLGAAAVGADEEVDLYCTYTWANGTTTTQLLTENIRTDGDQMFADMDDFCVYKGSNQNKPTSVSIIAVKKDAFGESSFGGATLGAGAGVTWTAS